MAKMTIVWDVPAKKSFYQQIKHIAKDSVQSAEQVRLDILSVIDSLLEHPDKYPPDRFKSDNDGSYRAFEKHSLRVAYFTSIDQIRILRVRHVKQEPIMY